MRGFLADRNRLLSLRPGTWSEVFCVPNFEDDDQQLIFPRSESLRMHVIAVIASQEVTACN